MKKNILYTMLFALVALVMTSCGDKQSEGLSRITYYPSIELKGDNYVVWEKGIPFEDPGYVSLLNGEDVTDKVTVSNMPDVNTSGIYEMTYTTMKNEDGFDASASRTVVVLDPNSAVEGFYLTATRWLLAMPLRSWLSTMVTVLSTLTTSSAVGIASVPAMAPSMPWVVLSLWQQTAQWG